MPTRTAQKGCPRGRHSRGPLAAVVAAAGRSRPGFFQLYIFTYILLIKYVCDSLPGWDPAAGPNRGAAAPADRDLPRLEARRHALRGPGLAHIRSGFPGAEIVLVGLPWAREFVGRYPAYPRRVPRVPGLSRACRSGSPTCERLPEFFEEYQGRAVRPRHPVARVGGNLQRGRRRGSAPGSTPDFMSRASVCPDPATFLPYPDRGLEVRRLLRLVEHLGIPARAASSWNSRSSTRMNVAGAWRSSAPGSSRRGYACIHGGASVPERRWPAERFAAVADALADRGLAIVLTGSAGEAGLTAAIARLDAVPRGRPGGEDAAWDPRGPAGQGAAARLQRHGRLPPGRRPARCRAWSSRPATIPSAGRRPTVACTGSSVAIQAWPSAR